MAISGLVNLLESITQQQFGQNQSDNNKFSAIGTSPIQNNAAPANTADRFTPSNQTTAQTEGLFQIAQFTAVANLPNPQAAPPQIDQDATPARIPSVPKPEAAVGTQTIVPTPAAPATVVANTTPARIEDQLQSLNTALSDLGLDNTQISQVDQIASVIQNFSPTAYSDIVYQLQALSRQPAQPSSTTAIGSSNANANGGAFQLQELALTFTGLHTAPANGPGSGNGSGQNAAANAASLQPFNLQVQEVQLTLSNNNGQTLQVQAGQPAAANATAG